MTVTAILLCGGRGSRFGGPTPKVFVDLAGEAVACWAYDACMSSPTIDAIVVVAPEEYRHLFVGSDKPRFFAAPGSSRQESLFNGMAAMPSSYYCIHDGARPFLTHPLIDAVVAAGQQHGAATAAVPARQTVKVGNADDFVTATLERSSLWEVQTPQVVEAAALRDGATHARTHGITVTDDVSLVEQLGLPVKLVAHHACNMKITTAEDLTVAEALMAIR